MIAKKDFEKMRRELGDFDNQREILIRKSRDIVKLSKKVIYSVHRNEKSKNHSPLLISLAL